MSEQPEKEKHYSEIGTQDAIAEQRKNMKAFKAAKKKYSVIEELPKLSPEPDYIIKTRPPMWDDWRLNIFRGMKENRLKMDANKISRRKCWETGLGYENCVKDGGMFSHLKCNG